MVQSKNFKIKFNRPKGNSFLRIRDNFYKNISIKTKVIISLAVSPPTAIVGPNTSKHHQKQWVKSPTEEHNAYTVFTNLSKQLREGLED